MQIQGVGSTVFINAHMDRYSISEAMHAVVTLSVENFDSLQGLDTNIRTISLQ